MKKIFISALILGTALASCTNEITSNHTQEEVKIEFQNFGHELVYNMVQKVGGMSKLRSLKDVVYSYSYKTPDGKEDIIKEKYFFAGELSYGTYEKHERTLPEVDGLIEQSYDGKEYWVKFDGKLSDDTVALKRAAFSRPTNFYWFTMFQKLLDPSVNYEHLGKREVDNKEYDVVNITFKKQDDKPTDIYQLFINKETSLVDQFLFTVADFGKMEIPLLMRMEYEEIDGMLIPAKRKYKASTWKAEVSDAPWIDVTWSDIKFNNGLTKKDFQK